MSSRAPTTEAGSSVFGRATEAGELVALMGPSGSGKTTLLRALSLIDPPTRGHILVDGHTERGKAVMDLLRRLGRERQAAVIVVTHDDRMLEGFDRVYRMTDGRIDIGERIHAPADAGVLVRR